MAASRLLSRSFAFCSARSQTTRSTRPTGFFPLINHLLQASPAAQSILRLRALRAYATAKGGRPKKPVSAKAPSQKEPVAKKAATKKPQSKKKPAKKPAKKPTKKPAKKTTKRVIKKKTEEQILVAKVRGLRKVALLDEPKRRPTTAWTLYNTQHIGKGQHVPQQVKENGRRYRNMSTSERESINQTAISNRALNAKAHNDWVRSHTPDAIRLANNARTRLNRLSANKRPSGARYTKRFSLLKDDRQLRRPVSGYMQFMADRWATGQFQGYKLAEGSKVMTEEWRGLTEADKKKYNDEAVVRKEQYLSESAELYPSVAERRQKAKVNEDRRRARDRSETLGR